ncbi:epidermal growth factor-like protein 7 isoform X1 [Oryctolagus cuniculus]|uniref:epidermal growth factor-like protein 7 isoform X1 n=1 Tax=Oryctolagus cuniculus TaxID=9986 RepID=UPI00222F11CE|nr:epidermal growth factor-like protein 7 isoform X1 [Oryctolagus cuniculus]XP_051697020.1 epidermal growth factor-like protein 7 isoform X1 [Oryctolagus cuniculus]XP_051697021.1 epidermal growth factor-like protein 7 isoform X1 [Oryctolagus cuniculus]
MWGSRELLLVWFLVLAAGGTEHVYRPGRRVCAVGVAEAPESFVQRVYQPFLTTCDGHRACSTYRTLYRTAYRRSPGPAPARPRYACCPGWRRSSGLPGACAAAVCQPPCRNGGSCVRPGRCHCPAGWRGDTCQTDVDECSSGRSGCPQRCVNTAGSYWCQCWEGHSPSADGRLCLPEGGAPSSAPSPPTGADGAVREEVRQLRARVDALEQVRPRRSLGHGCHPRGGGGAPCKDPVPGEASWLLSALGTPRDGTPPLHLSTPGRSCGASQRDSGPATPLASQQLGRRAHPSHPASPKRSSVWGVQSPCWPPLGSRGAEGRGAGRRHTCLPCRGCSWRWPRCTAWPRWPRSTGCRTRAASWSTPSGSWTAWTL